MKLYIGDNPTKSANEIVEAWNKAFDNKVVYRLVQSEEEYNDHTDNGNNSKRAQRFNLVRLTNGEKVYVSNQFSAERVDKFKDCLEKVGWNYNIEKIEDAK